MDNFLFKSHNIKKDCTMNKEELIIAIEDTLKDLENARIFFESVSDPKLIDVAIYWEEAIKAKYEYLIMEAKRINIKINYEYVFKDLKRIS